MRKVLRVAVACIAVAAIAPQHDTRLAAQSGLDKLDPLMQQRPLLGRSRVVVRVANTSAIAPVLNTVQMLGGQVLRQFAILPGAVVDLPNSAIATLAAEPLVSRLSYDRMSAGAMERTGATIGAPAVRAEFGLDGSGVGVAIIDSGVTPWHDDLANAAASAQRVDRFVDLVGGGVTSYDDYGHGTHVAGIVAGNGTDSSGRRSGIAPGAHLVVLKALDGSGNGRISDIIAALDYVVSHKDELNIRVVNLSVATGVYESYTSDPLTLAAQQAVNAGIVVVAAAGNYGRAASGRTLYGGVTAPGNAPWVLTVGASSHMGTIDRADDTMAPFSSRGPTAVDYGAKPDLVAPGVGIESLSNPGSWMYGAKPEALLSGTVPTSYFPYMSLSGTSMATPVVTGTAALMLQANPSLTPNAVKAILQYTSQVYSSYDPLTEGAGFLNAKGAVELASYFAAPATTPYPATGGWSGHIIWGNHVTSGGFLTAYANAWATNVTWGAARTPDGARIGWGVLCSLTDCATPWQTNCVNESCRNTYDVPAVFPNIVWGMMCGGTDCAMSWDAHFVRSTTVMEGDTVVWGTADPETDTVVWGTTDGEGDTVVWGTSCSDPSCQTVVWPPR